MFKGKEFHLAKKITSKLKEEKLIDINKVNIIRRVIQVVMEGKGEQRFIDKPLPLKREIGYRLNVIECDCISCFNNEYTKKVCRLPVFSLDDKGKCKSRRKRY